MAFLPSKRADPWLALTVFGLVLFGVIMVFSASVIVGHQLGDDQYFFKRQMVFAGLGFAAMVALANVDYRVWKKWAGWMLAFTYLLLISVFFFSRGEINGAHRWIQLGSLTFQPSELAKLTFIIYSSAWLAERKDRLDDLMGTFVPFLLVMGGIALLMLKEPDFGTLTIILVPAIVIYFLAGLNWRHAAIGVAVVLAALSLIMLSPYRRARVATFLNPSSDTSGQSYQVKNVSIAVGSGGLWGLGFGNSRQKRLFLPEPYTDSIFAVITEELGSLRSSLIILAFVFLMYRGYRIAWLVDDRFGAYLAAGITTWFGFQALINFGSMVQLVPLVGVPLPFISYGGTNLVVSLAAVGLLLNVSRYASEDASPVPAKRAYGRHA